MFFNATNLNNDHYIFLNTVQIIIYCKAYSTLGKIFDRNTELHVWLFNLVYGKNVVFWFTLCIIRAKKEITLFCYRPIFLTGMVNYDDVRLTYISKCAPSKNPFICIVINYNFLSFYVSVFLNVCTKLIYSSRLPTS